MYLTSGLPSLEESGGSSSCWYGGVRLMQRITPWKGDIWHLEVKRLCCSKMDLNNNFKTPSTPVHSKSWQIQTKNKTKHLKSNQVKIKTKPTYNPDLLPQNLRILQNCPFLNVRCLLGSRKIVLCFSFAGSPRRWISVFLSLSLGYF